MVIRIDVPRRLVGFVLQLQFLSERHLEEEFHLLV